MMDSLRHGEVCVSLFFSPFRPLILHFTSRTIISAALAFPLRFFTSSYFLFLAYLRHFYHENQIDPVCPPPPTPYVSYLPVFLFSNISFRVPPPSSTSTKSKPDPELD